MTSNMTIPALLLIAALLLAGILFSKFSSYKHLFLPKTEENTEENVVYTNGIWGEDVDS